MKKRNKKIISSAVITVLLLIILFAALVVQGIWNAAAREEETCRLKLDTMIDMVSFMDARQDSAEKAFEKKINQNVRFMAEALREFVTENGYTGPRLFSDGAVIEIQGEDILYPENMPKALQIVTPQLIEQTIKGETGYTFDVLLDKEDADQEEKEADEDLYMDYLKHEAGLAFAEISDDLYYMDWTTEDEFVNYLSANVNSEQIIEIAETTFGGALFLVDTDVIEGEQYLYNVSSWFPDCYTAGEIGFSEEDIEQKKLVMQLQGTSYVCIYKRFESMENIDLPEPVVVIYAEPLLPHMKRVLMRAALITLLALVIFATVAVWLISAQQYVRKRQLNEKELRQYYPSNLRKRAATAGLAGAVGVFAVTAVMHSLGAIQTETVEGRATAEILFEQLWEAEQNRAEEAKREAEEWYVYYGERIASLIAEHPELNTREKLQSFCSILNIDYIMVFDDRGRQTVTTSDFTDFTMDMGLGKDSSDFRRLLHGVSSIVHEPSEDQTTGLTRQMIGVKIPGVSDAEAQGALLMALLPESTASVLPDSEISDKLALLTPYGKLYFTADAKSGNILYAGDSSLIGRNVKECGLSQDTLSEDYMDFAVLDGQRSYVITTKRQSSICYYAARMSVLLNGTFSSALFAALVYLAAFFVLRKALLKGYTNEVFMNLTDMEAEKDPEPDVSGRESEDGEKEERDRIKRRMMSFLSERVQPLTVWEEKKPEERAGAVFKSLMLVLILLYGIQVTALSRLYEEEDSLLGFILYGDWKRGINLFALCSILILIGSAALIVEACKWALSLVADFSGSMGETVCGLLYSFTQYITLFVVLYFSFSYLGFPTQGILSSLGIVTLALSLGAKDLVSDILAGIFIVFEEQFKVGDYVSIDNYRGKVLEIGVRSTKLLGSGNDVKVINNSLIKNVINKSKQNSTCSTEVRIASTESYRKIEDLLNRELPKIGERYTEILSGPELSGISGGSGSPGIWNGGFYTILISASCMEKDYSTVMNIMNRELRLLFERENIETR